MLPKKIKSIIFHNFVLLFELTLTYSNAEQLGLHKTDLRWIVINKYHLWSNLFWYNWHLCLHIPIVQANSYLQKRSPSPTATICIWLSQRFQIFNIQEKNAMYLRPIKVAERLSWKTWLIVLTALHHLSTRVFLALNTVKPVYSATIGTAEIDTITGMTL